MGTRAHATRRGKAVRMVLEIRSFMVCGDGAENRELRSREQSQKETNDPYPFGAEVRGERIEGGMDASRMMGLDDHDGVPSGLSLSRMQAPAGKREQADRDESKNDREPKCGDANAYSGCSSGGQGSSFGCQKERKRGFCRADATRKHRGGTHQHGNRIEGQCRLKWKKDVQLMKQVNTGKRGQKPGKQSGCERYQRIQWRCQLPTVEQTITKCL